MERTDTVVIGAGQAGLALSRILTGAGHDHVVLDRGGVGERWTSERWDSLRLLTPNWMARLPGWSYRGPDPDGFMGAREVAGYLGAYARSFGAPVRGGTTVHRVAREGDGYVVDTDRGRWAADHVVVATGHCDRPAVPGAAAALDDAVEQLTPDRYRSPAALAPGGVLVVGASATGVQLAAEIHRSGRPVVLAVGTHTRVPRRYRGHDVMWWLERTGALDRRADAVADLAAARREPSLQLVGRASSGDGADPDGERDVDLAALQRAGVVLAGRLVAVDGAVVRFADDLAATVADADRRLTRVLDRCDAHARDRALAVPPPDRPAPVQVAGGPRRLDLRAAGIATVVWATGHRRAYPWLAVPVLDHAGEIVHDGGATRAPGLHVLGMRFQTRRRSSFLDGVRHDAALVAARIPARRAPALLAG